VFRDLPRYLLAADSPFRVRWRHLPELTPWLLRFLLHSTQQRSTATATALSHLLGRAYSGYAELITQAGLEPLVQRQACMYLYSGEAAFHASQPTLALRQRLGVQTQVLGPDEIAALEPALAPLFARGVLFPDSWFLSDPGAFVTQLAQWLVDRGMVLRTDAVTRISPLPAGVVLEAQGQTTAFDHVVLAAGAHARTLGGAVRRRLSRWVRSAATTCCFGRARPDLAPGGLGRARLVHDAHVARRARGRHGGTGRSGARAAPRPAGLAALRIQARLTRFG